MPYVVFATGIVWRNDKVTEDIGAMPNPWAAFWDVGEKYKGKVAILDDPRDALSLALFRERRRRDVNTEDPQVLAQALQGLKELDAAGQREGHRSTGTRPCPRARSGSRQDWTGDQIAAALYYMPKGVKPDVLSYWKPTIGGAGGERLMARASTGKKPVLAHRSSNFMLDETNALQQLRRLQRLPAAAERTRLRDAAVEAGPARLGARRRSCSATTSRPASRT